MGQVKGRIIRCIKAAYCPFLVAGFFLWRIFYGEFDTVLQASLSSSSGSSVSSSSLLQLWFPASNWGFKGKLMGIVQIFLRDVTAIADSSSSAGAAFLLFLKWDKG